MPKTTRADQSPSGRRSAWDISTDLARGIDNGTLKPGDELLSRAQLADLYGVSQATILRALDMVKFSGRIRGEQGRAIYVVGPKDTAAPKHAGGPT